MIGLAARKAAFLEVIVKASPSHLETCRPSECVCPDAAFNEAIAAACKVNA